MKGVLRSLKQCTPATKTNVIPLHFIPVVLSARISSYQQTKSTQVIYCKVTTAIDWKWSIVCNARDIYTVLKSSIEHFGEKHTTILHNLFTERFYSAAGCMIHYQRAKLHQQYFPPKLQNPSIVVTRCCFHYPLHIPFFQTSWAAIRQNLTV